VAFPKQQTIFPRGPGRLCLLLPYKIQTTTLSLTLPSWMANLGIMGTIAEVAWQDNLPAWVGDRNDWLRTSAN
jgi:hypothetical protein